MPHPYLAWTRQTLGEKFAHLNQARGFPPSHRHERTSRARIDCNLLTTREAKCSQIRKRPTERSNVVALRAANELPGWPTRPADLSRWMVFQPDLVLPQERDAKVPSDLQQLGALHLCFHAIVTTVLGVVDVAAGVLAVVVSQVPQDHRSDERAIAELRVGVLRVLLRLLLPGHDADVRTVVRAHELEPRGRPVLLS